MTVILPSDHHARQALINRRIDCISQERAVRQDIRALRIGVLNIMPQAENYEFSVLFPLGRSVMQIIPVWIKLKSHPYRSSSSTHLENLYVTFEEAVRERHLDALIVTGAPVEGMPFEEVTYWEEVRQILDYARENIVSTLGICWGGLAMARTLGIEKIQYEKKLFGVFPAKSLDTHHRIIGECDDIFHIPQSRLAGIADKVLEAKRDEGILDLLASSEPGGYTIFETRDKRFLMHLGHPEYDAGRLVVEYERDRALGLEGVAPPENVDLGNPINVWRCNGLEFFSQWIKDAYERTPF